MLKAALLFVPLLAGYVFACTWSYTRFKAAREDAQRIYFRAAYYGIFLAAVAFLLCLLILAHRSATYTELGAFIDALTLWSILDGENVDAATPVHEWGFVAAFLTLTITLGSLLGFSLNGVAHCGNWVSQRTRRPAWMWRALSPMLNPIEKAIHDGGDDIEVILLRAIKKTMPVLATMSNGKVYVGHVVELAEPRDTRKTLRLAPLLSGYREKNRGTVSFTTSYTDLYERILECWESGSGDLAHLDIDDFEIVLPSSHLQSISLFDIAAYNRFQPQPSEPAAENAPLPSAATPEPGLSNTAPTA